MGESHQLTQAPGLLGWLDHRTGYRKVMDALLLENIPGGAKWRYVWGSALLMVFSIQLITGVLLMTAYSPSDTTAWSSVYYIQYQMEFGWLIRGLHHFGSQTMVVLLGIHMLQVVIAGAHLPPREVNWWLGLGLLGCVLGLSLTGYLLPWDQKGYWATQVATNIAGNLPVLGPWIQKIVVGGPTYGHHTLSRFYTLHVAILPPLVIVLTILHMVVFRRHGVTHPKNPVGQGEFWPDQAFRDMIVGLAIFGIMLALVLFGHGHAVAEPRPTESLWDRMAYAGQAGKGANLDAPADPARPYPARPEWYFLSLFQLLKYFEGDQEIIGTVIIPAGMGALLFLLPLLGYGRMRPFGHVVGVGVVSCILVSAAALTVLAILEDSADPNKSEKARVFHHELEKASAAAHQAVQLAHKGVPVEGAVMLLRRDPETRGRELFKENCATCHTYGDAFKNDKPTASDLEGFGSEKWVRELLANPADPRFFGRTKLTGMTRWVEKQRSKAKGDSLKQLDAEWDLIAKWLATHPTQPPKEGETGDLAKGYEAYVGACATCHTFKGEGGGTAPDFTGYGGADWIRLMILSPDHPLRYGNKNTMPLFRDVEGPTGTFTRQELEWTKNLLSKEIPDDAADAADKRKAIEEARRLIHLSDADRELIIRFMLNQKHVVFGGTPVAPAR